jgi:hypothetical protein
MSEQEIRGALNGIINYEYASEWLDALKAALRRRLAQVDESQKMGEGMREWAANIEGDFDRFTENVGHPHYTAGDPYGGGRPELVQNPKNIMIDSVDKKIAACINTAAAIRAERHREDMASRTVYQEAPTTSSLRPHRLVP